MSPSTLRVLVTIEYDSRGVRVTRELEMYAARRLWVAKDKAGRNPKIIKDKA